MKISILGSGPIPDKLAQTLCGKSSVSLFTSQAITINSVQVFKYEDFLSQIIDFDILIIAWRGLPSSGSERGKVLKYLVQSIPSESVVFNLSSVAVYGQNPGINYETTVPKPINPYGHSKLDLETYLNAYCASKVCNLRISNVFGDFKFNDIVNRMLIANSCSKPIVLIEPEKLYRDYISMDFLIVVLTSLLDSSKQLDRRSLFNISSGTSLNLLELKEFIEASLRTQIAFSISDSTPTIIENSKVSNLKVSQYLQIFSNNNLEHLRHYVTKS